MFKGKIIQVSFSIVSINIGILGFMTFWSVRLDFISMVTIVMSIGFCVDFAAHLAYNFAKVGYCNIIYYILF